MRLSIVANVAERRKSLLYLSEYYAIFFSQRSLINRNAMTSSIVPQNGLRKKIVDGRTVFGTMIVEIHQASVIQLLANAGFDFVIIDGEHGPFTIVHIAELSRAAVAAGMTPIVRVPEIAYTPITQALDAGAQGIMIPRVVRKQQVEEAVSIMKYPPVGIRGSVLARGHTRFQWGDVRRAMDEFNRETMLIVQVETKQGLEACDALAQIPGVDALLIGPNDLSIALGIPGEYTHQTFIAAVEKTVAACKKHNITAALHANDLPTLTTWLQHGLRMVSFHSEAGMMMQAGTLALKELQEVKAGS